MNDELERMQKETIVSCSQGLSRNSPGGTKENHETLSRRLGQDSNRAPAGYKLETSLEPPWAGVRY
jgi:hypothetical protein